MPTHYGAEEMRDAVAEANCSGAYTCTHLGVIDGLPTRAELESFTVSGCNNS